MNLAEMLLGGPGLNAYAYQADVYCPDCGQEIIRELWADTADVPDEEACRDTELWPQPVFFGESDIPQHCGECHEYLYGG